VNTRDLFDYVKLVYPEQSEQPIQTDNSFIDSVFISIHQTYFLISNMSTIYHPTNLTVDINSMIGRLSLQQTETALSQSVRNLSSGLRIHSGRDDPIGFISSTAMRTDIVSLSQAVANSQRANSVISTIDSTLSHLNNLLNDLRGLVTQAANTGAENQETLAMLQIQADAVLNSIDMLTYSTTYQNQKLLDGSLDFTTYGIDQNKIDLLNINQANFLGRTEKDISVQVLEPPQQAKLYYPLGALKDDVVLDIGGTGGYQTLMFDKDAAVQDIADAVNRFSDATGVAATVYSEATPGTLSLTSYGKNNDLLLTSSESGTAAGNFVVRYTAPKEGNENLSVNVSPSNGNEPAVIEIVLQTELWKNAEYHYNGNQDGVSNNEFSITAQNSGETFNDIQFVFNNVYGTDQETGIDVRLQDSPKTFSINVSYNESDPNDLSNTTVNDLADWIKASPVANAYFQLQNTPPSDGTGVLIPSTTFEQSQIGVNGGTVLTTAEQVAALLNTSPLLKNPDGTGQLSATIPNNSTGLGTVSPFTEVSYYGNIQENNYLQFLAPPNSPSIRFVSTPGTSLLVDDSSDPPVYGYASTQIQGLDAGTSFTLRSLTPGLENDQVAVLLQDKTNESVVFDAERNAVIISVDFTGRAEDPSRGDFSMEDLKQLVANDPFVSSRFSVIPLTSYDPNQPPTFSDSGYRGIDAQVGKTSGGLLSAGTVLIHLETDTNGLVKTTANDLVRFFNDPSTEESKQVLDRLGISVSVLAPNNPNGTVCTTGESGIGNGLLQPTYDPDAVDCVVLEGQYPDLKFSSYGAEIKEEYPTATISSTNGQSSDFTITALHAGASYNNTTVRVVADAAGPVAQYNSVSKELTIGIPSQSVITVDEIVKLINSDPVLNTQFVASRGELSDGGGRIAVGDWATLTGGVRPVDLRPEGTVVSANGVNAMFQVSAKQAGEQWNDTEIIIVADSSGSRVSYDAQSKQLTIGVLPENPATAQEIVNLINSTPEIRDYFEASLPLIAEGTSLVPTGEDAVHIGDSGTLQPHVTETKLGVPMIGNSNNTNLGITFHSVEYGSQEFVAVRATLDTDFPLTDRFGNVAEKTYGTDVVAKINGQLATGTGRIASTATSDLDMSIWINPNVQKGDVFGFRITGGGALIQLGPDAVSEQQARIAVKSVHTIALGGVNGYLSQLKTGGQYDLLTDTATAFKIVEDVTAEVSAIRGRLGAFQKNQIQANMQNMQDAIEIETTAYSEIVDTDFAVESSAFARQQLLLQSGISVLQQNGQNTQLLLGLLQR
jgi:flagellin-like hook-associated protein FlgL